MTKIFRLKGLGCASCAAKIEKRVSKLDGVTASSVNFATARLVIEGDDNRMPSIVELASDIVRKLEPHVVMEPVK